MKIILSLTFLVLFSCNQKPSGFDKRLKTYHYPYKTKLFKFLSQSQKLEMAYMIAKPSKKSDNGKYFVLIHGKNFAGPYYETIAKLLTNKGYTVLMPDLIGFGRSSKPVNYQYTIHGLANSLKKLMKWHSIKKANILGHSMGGMVATRFALMYPSRTEKLFLINPIGLEDYKTFAPYKTIDQAYEAQLKLTPKKVKEYQSISYYDNKWKDAYDQWLKIQTGWIKGPDWRQLAYISALTYNMIYTQPVYYEFANLKPKTILIIGDRDRTALGKGDVSKEVRKKIGQYQELGPKINKLIPNSTLHVLKGLGHLPHIENFEKFKEAFNKEI